MGSLNRREALPPSGLYYASKMTSLPKVRVLWILGVMLVCIGALFHSHAESWAVSVSVVNDTPMGKVGTLDYPLDYLFADSGIAMMAMGGIAFTLGIIGWLYPPGGEQGI
jgi:hypothetical protein